MFSFFSFLFVFLLVVLVKSEDSVTSKLDNGCISKADGSYWLQLMESTDDDSYPAIYAKCSNEYAILDYNYDNNVKEYFSTWNYWHYAIAGPNNGDTVNWEQWYLASDDNTKYLVSPDCTTCDEGSSLQYYETKTTYWMTGNLFSCWWLVKGFPVCDLDWETYSCHYCGDDYYHGDSDVITIDENSPSDYYAMTGQCVTSIESSQLTVPTSHEGCTSKSDDGVMKPSIGIDGRFCVCVQPSEQKTFDVDNDDLLNYQSQLSSLFSPKTTETVTSSSNIVELYAKDFEYGTYRITKAGTYKIMEDIEFEFNAGDSSDPFAEGSWWPSSSQVEQYPGAGDLRDSYFLGFFAGITIETSDVIIDLNDHTLKMSDLYYYHQRWFSIIELASQYFLPGQGPGFLGHDPQFGSNVVIKNGILGLSSHFGIHGNFNDNVQILNVKVQNFETHGIQLNGWSNVVLSNVDIGPSSTQAYLKAEFGHARVILPRLRLIAEESPTSTVNFANRKEMTMSDIADELEAEMKLALQWAITKTEPILEDNEAKMQWMKAKDLFINENGTPFSSSLTGLFLNLHSTSVFTFNLDTDDYSQGAKIENVKIHDFTHSFKEWIRLSSGPEIFVNPFTAPMDALAMIGEEELDHYLIELDNDFSKATYKGNTLTDAYIAMNKMSDNWGYLGGMMIKNSVTTAWAESESSFFEGWAFGCNVDPMLHSGKGILGFRMDGVQNVDINGLEIYNLYESTPLGRTECGAYSDVFNNIVDRQAGGHFRQLRPIQDGFSGNMVLAVSIASSRDMTLKNIDIHDIESETGLIHGVAVWTHCTNISFQENINMYNFNAGSQVELDTYSYSDRPNKAPEVCAFKIQWETILSGESVDGYKTTDIRYDEVNKWTICNMQGHVGCSGDDEYTTETSISYDSSSCSSSDEVDNNVYKINKIIQSGEKHANTYLYPLIILGSIIIIVCASIAIFLYKHYNSNDVSSSKITQNKLDYKYALINDCNTVNYGSIQNNDNHSV